jgi:hypothetical protein
MAFYVHAQPPAYDASPYSGLWFRMGSDNASQPSYRFLVDIYVSGNFVLTLKVMPDASYAGLIDISRVVRNYMNTNYFIPDATTNPPFYWDTNVFDLSLTVIFREEYLAGGGIVTSTTLDVVPLRVRNAYNLDTPTNGHPYVPTYGRQYNWLTSRNTSAIWVPRNTNAFISFLNDPATDFYLNIQYLDEDGKPFTSGVLGAASDPVGVSSRLLILNLNETALAASSAWTSPPVPLIPANAGGFRLYLSKVGPPPAPCPAIDVRFLCEPKVKASPLHFLNRFGGFDTFFFTGPKRAAMEVERKSFQTIPAFIQTSAVSEFSPANVFADTTVNYHTRHTWTRKLVSGYLNDTDYKFLSELLASPVVYYEEDGFYFPVTIKESKWSQKLTRFDKVYNLELEITTGRQVISQIR